MAGKIGSSKPVVPCDAAVQTGQPSNQVRSPPVRQRVKNASGVEQSDPGNVNNPERNDGDAHEEGELGRHEDFSVSDLIEVEEMGTVSSVGTVKTSQAEKTAAGDIHMPADPGARAEPSVNPDIWLFCERNSLRDSESNLFRILLLFLPIFTSLNVHRCHILGKLWIVNLENGFFNWRSALKGRNVLEYKP